MLGFEDRSPASTRDYDLDNFELSLDMADYPVAQYSHQEIKRAGKIIADSPRVSAEIPEEVRRAFLVANDWRLAHAYPMQSVHASIRHHVRSNDLNGITAARLKRMQAIRRKLSRIGLGLDQIQDLGGCRVILPTIANTHTLVEILRTKLPSRIHKENDFISNPKDDGYRSHHLILSFARPKSTPFDGKRIELQIRTKLQHSWATAVEAVGLLRGEELKNRKGSPDWLRFFALMSSEFAEAEKCSTVPGTPEAKLRKEEIRVLASSLDALAILDSVSDGFRGTDIPLSFGYIPSHYLIRYDREKRTVNVEPHQKPRIAAASYDKAEEALRADESGGVVVLVEVDKIENLKAAYPNYFGDVGLFKSQLREIVLGRSAVEYEVPPKQPIRKLSSEAGVDPSWLRGTRFPKPKLRQKKKKKNS